MKTCEGCIHLEVCCYSAPLLPRCDSYMQITKCENCDCWEMKGYLDGYGICLRTRTLEHKTHYCSAGQPSLTVEEEA